MSRVLKVGSEGESRIVGGREFQSRGAAREKARSPKDLSLDGGMVRVAEEEDRSEREGRWGMRRSVR